MSVPYTLPIIDSRLRAVVTTIDGAGNGYLVLRYRTNNLSTFQLARPSGTVWNGILTFDGQLLDPAASGTGLADNAIIQDASGNTIVSGLTVGSSSSQGYDVLINNGLNSTLISTGDVIEITSATIQGA